MKPWFSHSFHQEPVPLPYTDKSQFPIRIALPEDLAGVAQIIANSFHSQKGIWGWAFPLLRLGIYEDLRHRFLSPAPYHVCLVAFETTECGEDLLIGTVELAVRYTDSWVQVGKSFPYLSNLAVHPEHRRRGVASDLLQVCEKYALSWGFKDLYLHVLENNHQARQLYFKTGYRVHKAEPNWNLVFFRQSQQLLLHKRLTCPL